MKPITDSTPSWGSKVPFSAYEFDLSRVIASPDACKLFRDYLQGISTSEQIDFLAVYNKLLAKGISEAEQIQLSTELMAKFIKNGSPREIKVSSSVTKPIVEAFYNALSRNIDAGKWFLRDRPERFFLPIQRILLAQLNATHFPLFLRSELWSSFIATKEKAFIETIADLKPPSEFNFKNQDFEEHIVTEKDYAFMDECAKDSFDWELVGYSVSDKGSAHAFWGTKNYMPAVDWMRNGTYYKFCGTFNFNLDFMAKSMFAVERFAMYNQNVSQIVPLLYHTKEDLRSVFSEDLIKHVNPVAVLDFKLKLRFPFTTTRRDLVCSSIRYDPSREEITLLVKPCVIDGYQMKSKHIQIKDMLYIRLRKIDDNQTEVTQVHLANFGGWLNSKEFVKKATFWERAKSFHKQLRKFLKQCEKKHFVDDESDMWVLLLQEAEVEKRRQDYTKKFALYNKFILGV